MRALVVGLLVVLSGRSAHPATDPAREWVTLTSAHFALHTYDGGVALAPDVLAYLEDAYVTVGEALGWRPRARVHVTLLDDVDSANGFAITKPWPGITLYAWPPEPEGELGSYANWLRLLCLHEYAHIAHIDAAFGIPEIVNQVFGPVWSPNDALPRWVTEGIATWIESAQSGGGRVGSTLSEMHMRTAALAGAELSLAELTGYPLQHPRAGAWYQVGGYLFDTIARARGADAVRAFSHAYAERPIPLALNNVARATTGKTLVDWHAQVLDEARIRAHAVRDAVMREGLVEGLALTRAGEVQIEPRFSPDGRWLAWVRTTGHDATRLVRVPVASLAPLEDGQVEAEPEDVLTCYGGCGAFTFTRDGGRLVTSTARHHRVGNYHGVLAELPFAADLPRRTPRILTGSRRGHDPAMAADGRSVWFARAIWGWPSLARVDLATGDLLETWELPDEARGSHPRIDRPAPSPDGRSLYLSIHRDGNRDLYRLDLASRALERLTQGSAMEIHPSVTADGRWLVYASDRDGVWNVHARELATGVTRRLTNVLGAAMYPAVSPDGALLVFASWGLRGHDLRALPFAPDDAPIVAAPDDRGSRPREVARPITTSRHDYQAVQTLLPRAFLPDLTIDSTGLSRVALAVEALDASSRFGLSLGADWSPADDRWSAWGSLSLSLGFPDLTLGLGRYSFGRESFVGDLAEPYEQEVVYASAAVSFPFPDVFAGLNLGLGYTVDLARGMEVGALRHTPEESTAFVPYEGASTALNVYAGFTDARQYTFSVAPASGVSGSFNFALRHPYIGSVGQAWTFTWVTRAWLPVPGLDAFDHALGFRLGGGIAGGAPEARSFFSLGGVPRQDLLSDLLNQTSAGAAWMRGFAPDAFAGHAFFLATAEYRLPLLRVRSGLSTLPVFLEDLGLAAFTDIGGATFDAAFPDDALHVGVGLELRFRLDISYGLLADFRVGYARGLGADGIDHVYLLMAGIP